jgi:hypothetical protein
VIGIEMNGSSRFGQGYGAEPPTVDADYGRVSYTQFEFLYARQRNRDGYGIEIFNKTSETLKL